MEPLLSFVVPATPAWAPYLRRMLRSLSLSTDLRFEVVVVADGGDNGDLAAVASAAWPFGVALVDGPRPGGPIPHRNHARNAGVRAAKGRWVWIADCDFVWHSRAVEHALVAVMEAEAAGELLALSPCLAVITEQPDIYVADSEDWADHGVEVGEALAGRYKTAGTEWEGKADLYLPGDTPRVDAVASLPEGFPLVSKAVVEALGGFDERFLRWGGNKIEFTFRLGALEPWLRYRVLRSICCWHQPHPQDSNKPVDDPHRVANQSLYHERTREVRGGAAWWLREKERVKAIALRLREGVALESGAEAHDLIRVGLVTVGDRVKGIARDIDMIAEVLRDGARRRLGAPDPVLSFYTVESGARFASAGCPSLEGPTWSAWIKGLHVVVIAEFLPVDQINEALAVGVRVIYIPNADWAIHGTSEKSWVSVVRALALRQGFTVVAKSPEWGEELKRQKIKHAVLPWIATEPVVGDRPCPSGPVRFFANLGLGGYQSRRGADVILAAWALAGFSPEQATLTLKSGRALADMVPAGFAAKLDGINVIEADWTRKQIQDAWLGADVVLYPSRWEGFGLSLSEALNAGCPVIVPDAWPMREQVRHEHSGLVIPAEDKGRMRLAPRVEVEPQVLADAMKRLVREPELLRRLTCPHPGARMAEQLAMRLRWRALLLGEAEPRVLIIRGDGAGPQGTRSEDSWRWAFARAGFLVALVSESEVAALPRTLEGGYDFVMISKARPSTVAALRGLVGSGTPIVCWHHDLIDFTAERAAWMEEIARLVDLTLVSEAGPLGAYGARVATLHPAAFCRQRPSGIPAKPRRELVFTGGCFGADDARVRLLRNLQAGLGWPLEVRSVDEAKWRQCKVDALPAVSGDDAAKLYEGAVCPSISRSTMHSFYTSDRLFCIACAGGVPLVPAFPGLEEIYPRGVVTIASAEEGVSRLKAMTDAELRAVQWDALEVTWRTHTWEDRILSIAEAMAPPSSRRRSVEIGDASDLSDPRFGRLWDERASSVGRRGVAHTAWTNSTFLAETEEWWKRIARQLGHRLKPKDARVLDFGCGVGRWTARIAKELGREVFGVDVSPTMVAMARKDHPALDFRAINPTKPLPFPDGFFDMIFTCTVLQHIPDEELRQVTAELLRVSRPGALIFLLENCHAAKRRTSVSGHVVFRTELEYRQIFQGIGEQESWMVEGEKHAILAGRRR